MSMYMSYPEEGWWLRWKTITGLEFAGRQKERKREASLEKDGFEGNRKMRQNLEQG